MAAVVASSAASALSSIRTASDLIGQIRASSGIGLALQIENLTRFPLTNPEVRLYKGYNTIPPVFAPGSRDAISLEKGAGCNGTFGTVSWLIDMGRELESRRVVAMWYMPYNFNHHVNKFAVGITEPGLNSVHQDGDAWYYFMAEDNRQGVQHPFTYARRDYYYDVRTVEVSDLLFEVEGTCGTTHICEAKVAIRPKNNGDLAPRIQRLLQESGSIAQLDNVSQSGDILPIQATT